MESTHTQTTTVWTDEKHLHFLNTMEASFVRRMLHHYAALSSHLLSASTATSPTPLNQPSIPNPFAGPRNIPIHPQIQWVLLRGEEDRRGDHLILNLTYRVHW
ncbi:hypothetical protein ACSQ67_014068 [Phaseolus vulgaris]